MGRLLQPQRLCYVLIMAEAPTDAVLQILIKIQDSIVAQTRGSNGSKTSSGSSAAKAPACW